MDETTFKTLYKTVVADRKPNQAKQDQQALIELRESVEQNLGTTSDLHNRVLVLETDAKHLATKAWVFRTMFTIVGIMTGIMIAISKLF